MKDQHLPSPEELPQACAYSRNVFSYMDLNDPANHNSVLKKHLAECSICQGIYANIKAILTAIDKRVPLKEISPAYRQEIQRSLCAMVREVGKRDSHTWALRLRVRLQQGAWFLRDIVLAVFSVRMAVAVVGVLMVSALAKLLV